MYFLCNDSFHRKFNSDETHIIHHSGFWGAIQIGTSNCGIGDYKLFDTLEAFNADNEMGKC